MPRLAGKDRCTGCTACAAVCPVSCIQMQRDDEGFLQPIVGQACVKCGKCERVCPILNGIEGHSNARQIAFAAICKDEGLWQSSTSGGAFTCLCEAFAAQAPYAETVVYGASMQFPQVKHIRCSASDVTPLRKSKYVQSDKGESFRSVRNDLKAGKRVVFSGTPCEVAGLYSYLGKLAETDALLLIDLICHGAGSPAVFERCVSSASSKFGDVVGYEFRCKKPVLGNYERYVSRYIYLNKHHDRKTKYIRIDEYNKLFLNQVCLRRSCMERCHFRNRQRFGDVTLADLNGKDELYPQNNDCRGWSTVVGNTDKGRAIIRQLSGYMDMHELSTDDVARYNPLFDHSTPGNPRRNEFFKRFIAGDDMGVLAKEYGLKISLRSTLLLHIPHGLKQRLKKLMRKVRL